jgi:predicted nucleotidyltransferase component of viral defense system
MSNFFSNILDKNQLEILPRLKIISNYNLYLAGGTALALQLGHRTSVDLDFFTPEHFDSNKLYKDLEKEFGNNIKNIGEEKDTLFIKIFDVDLSFFWYQYKLIDKTEVFENVNLASLKDISAMKLLAITGRPAVRDYIDIFYLLKEFRISEIFDFADEKYPTFNDYLALRALTYFDEVTEVEGKRPIKVLDPDFSWNKAKKFIFEEVKKNQLGMFKK